MPKVKIDHIISFSSEDSVGLNIYYSKINLNVIIFI